MRPVEMRNGATVSGAMHLGFLALALFGTDFFAARDPAPLAVTEVELIDGVDFEARLSTAPLVPSKGPAELAPEAPGEVEPIDLTTPDVTIDVPEMPILALAEATPDEAPDLAALAIPPPPTVVPNEPSRPSIAVIPSPDSMVRQAAEPESPPATEPVQALAAAPVPEPAPRPAPPLESDPITVEPATAEAPRTATEPAPSPDLPPRQAAEPESPPATKLAQALAAAPDPEPAPRPAPPLESDPITVEPATAEAPRAATAPAPSPDVQPRLAPEPEIPAATEPLQPLATAPPPEPKPETPRHQPEPEPVAVAQPDAPVSQAPREARLPVARPAKLAAAAPASSAPDPVAPPPQPAEAREPAEPAGGSTSQFASAVTEGEKDALRLGIKQHFFYPGNRSDRSLQVTIRVRLGRDAKMIGQPEFLKGSGGDDNTRRALFMAGRRALFKAQSAGEFNKLPPDKYNGWKLIHVTFTPEEIGFSS
jgi:hypothetical protein